MAALAKKRINITHKVSGRLKQGEMLLYYNKKPIGRIDLINRTGVEVTEGFEVDGHNIYVVSNAEDRQYDSYTQGCDLGWC